MAIVLTDDSTLPAVFLARLRESPDTPAYRYYDGGQWKQLTWSQVVQEVQRWQAAMRKEGLVAGDRVGICLRNRLEWMLFDQAALGLGLVVVPLYYNDRPENMAFCLDDAGVRLLLLEDASLWPQMKPHVKGLERVVCLTECTSPDEKSVRLQDWLPLTGLSYEGGVPKADDLATIVYTSGTTGRPKGVMLTHRNIVTDLRALMIAVPELLQTRHEFLSFLPLSHMFERTVGYYIPICINALVTYARGIPELSEDLVSQKPTALVSVPRIFERIYSKIDAELPVGSPKRKLFDKTVDIGWKRFTKQATLAERMQWPILNALVGRKVRARLGGRLQFIKLGGAALAPHLLKVFTGVGFTFIHGYGLTETSPVLSCNRLNDNDPLSVGKPLEGVETRITETGELLVRGPIIMRGYWNNPVATSAVIDDDGWFHTGDVVEVKDRRIYIRGRLKDIIVLSNGEKLPPGDVEQAIMQDGVFEQVMVVGEGRAKPGLLVVSKLTDERELCARANAQLHAFPGYARIWHIARVPDAWTIENGMLTPTLKLKRNKIEEKYATEIEAMYQTKAACSP